MGDLYVPDVVPEADREFYESRHRYGNRVGWGEHPAILIVDMTLAFIDEDPDGEACVEANARLLDAARAVEAPVYYTTPAPAGSGPEGYPVTTKASPASSRGPERGGEGRPAWLDKLDVIAPQLEPRADEQVIQKERASAFFDTHLANMLRYDGVDTLVVAGMTTSGCIRSTVVDSHSSNFRTIVPQECVSDPSTISHEVGLFDMDVKYADVTPLDEVIEKLRSYDS